MPAHPDVVGSCPFLLEGPDRSFWQCSVLQNGPARKAAGAGAASAGKSPLDFPARNDTNPIRICVTAPFSKNMLTRTVVDGGAFLPEGRNRTF